LLGLEDLLKSLRLYSIKTDERCYSQANLDNYLALFNQRKMAEGGLFPWKVQELLSRGLAGNYSGLRDPLPKTPPGMGWKQDEGTREWKLAETGKEPELVPEEHPACLIELPKEVIDQNVEENEWEVLSVGGSGIFVARAGSVRSINSMEQEHSSHTTLSVPYKIQRTASSSTIDSQDNALGPSGKGVLGVDYVEHVVLPTDTLQGILIAYKVSASNLRRANHFTGHSLHFAPKKLLIPLSKQALRTGFIRVQDTDSKEYKLRYFQVEYPDLSLTEKKA
jgi:LysM repeat protein